MITLVGIFFSLISLLGIVKGNKKSSLRKLVLIGFSVFLIVGQILFMYSYLNVESQQFIGFSGLISGIILILAYQKNAAW
ncbi:MAG TPA: hypothetical protein VNW04_08390 [Puia sp.]|jgi:hypothetical protein|nr:hypothetical protein [Puia sp.]